MWLASGYLFMLACLWTLFALPVISASFSGDPSDSSSPSQLSENVLQTNVRSKRQDPPQTIDHSLMIEVTTSDLFATYGSCNKIIGKFVMDIGENGGILPPPFISLPTILSFAMISMLRRYETEGGNMGGENIQYDLLGELFEKQHHLAMQINNQLAAAELDVHRDLKHIVDSIGAITRIYRSNTKGTPLRPPHNESEALLNFVKFPNKTTVADIPVGDELIRIVKNIRSFVEAFNTTMFVEVRGNSISRFSTAVNGLSLASFLFHFGIAKKCYAEGLSATSIPDMPEFQAFEAVRSEVAQLLWNVRNDRFKPDVFFDIYPPLRHFLNLPQFPVMNRTIVDAFYQRIEEYTTPLVNNITIPTNCKDFLTTGWVIAIGFFVMLI